MEETRRALSGRTSVHLSPSHFCALNMKPFCFGFGLKRRVSELGQVRWIHSFPLMVKVPRERNQDLYVNLLGQHRCEDAFQ